MILIVPEKSMVKKGGKFVRPKDFIIADATQDAGNEISAMGQRERCDEFTPTPTLRKIALDPDNAESKIKRRNLQKYIEMWLDDPGFKLKLNFLMSSIVANWKRTGEDMNVFIVLEKVSYREYASYLKDHIEEIYGKGTATLLTHKMDKEVINEIISKKYDNDFMNEVKRRAKAIAKDLAKDGINKGEYFNTDDD